MRGGLEACRGKVRIIRDEILDLREHLVKNPEITKFLYKKEDNKISEQLHKADMALKEVRKLLTFGEDE